MSIRLKIGGFEELIKEIEKAEGNADAACEQALKKSAVIMEDELTAEMEKSHVDSKLISRMPSYEIEKNHGLITARVGYKKGAYNPDNLSDGYKVVFANYGTPRRSKHGKIVDVSDGGKIKLGFIDRAKRKAKPKIYRVQKKTLEEILRGLK